MALFGWGDLYRRNLAVSELEAELERMRAVESTLPQRGRAQAAAYAKDARELISLRSPAWVHALNALEAQPPSADVAVLDLQVMPALGEVRVRLSAGGYPLLLDWLAALNAASADHPGGWHWVLLSAETDPSQGRLAVQILALRRTESSASSEVRVNSN
jgi:hypothetical protein